MRWLFLLLLLLNIAYIAWGVYRPAVPTRPVTEARNNNIPPVKLLQELNNEQQAAAGDSEQQPGGAPGPDKQADPARKGFACYTLGPFRKLDVLSAFTREIRTYVIEASFRSREETEQSIFQVYLRPPAGGKKEAAAIRKQLTASKLNDHYIITSGANANGISLGHFSEMDRAFSLASRVEKLGFAPVVEPILRATTIYWLDYRVQADKDIPEAVFERHLDPDISRFDRPCN